MYQNLNISLTVRLDANLVVKISDFGLTKDVHNKDYYKSEDTNKPIPIRWMSVEACQLRQFTLESDVACIDNILVHLVQQI